MKIYKNQNGQQLLLIYEIVTFEIDNMSYTTYNIRREYMKEYTVEFYAAKDGREPAKEFIEK